MPSKAVGVLTARTVVGVSISILGLLLLLFAVLDFNNLFFVQKNLSKSDIPTYDQFVVLPALLGLLVLFDGSLVLGLKRTFSLSLHLLGNFVWLYALYLVYQNLAIPVTEVAAYRQIFYLFFFGTVFFVIGTIVNDIPQRQEQ
jgi:hypothetical protein